MLGTLPFTFAALGKAYEKGVSPVDVIDEVLARLQSVKDPGIFIHLRDPAALRDEAAALGAYDPAKPLWGIPYAVKDNIDVAGIETTAACPAFAYEADRDAFAVAKLRDAGALMIGKTNLDQFATGLVGVRSPYPPPKNAIDPSLVPGGSSSGSAVAVSHGIVAFALGTDTAGSGRVPAALNNIVGLKPTLGSVSATGMVPACRTLDTISVFAQTVEDAYGAFDVMLGFDPQDAYSRRFDRKPLTAIPACLRIGIPDSDSIEFFGDTSQQDAFDRDVAILTGTGAQIERIDFSTLFAVARMLYEGAWVAERYAAIEDVLNRDPEAVHPVTRHIINHAVGMSAVDAFRGMYRLADLKRSAEPVLAGLDLLCVPTIPTYYSVAALEADPVTPNSNLGIYTNFVNLMDMCGIAVPTEPRSDGRPSSITVLARAGQDDLAASVARGFEAGGLRTMGATGHPVPRPPQLPASPTDRIEIAVCGAHMSGLPLNGQLTDRGGRFVSEAKTAAQYQFYALPGGPPARPGLVRSTSPHSSAISLEIWSLPKSELGDFIEGIPAPLGVGSIELSDGRWVKGFLCEASGVAGAEEISEIGDWRKYLMQAA